MALKGDLRDFSTTQLLNLINLARKTGTLTIEGSQVAHMSFREGKLIYATLGETVGDLALILRRAGKLSDEQVKIIQVRAPNTSDKQLGHLLIQAGYVTQSDIIQSVRQHVLEIVYKLFTWVEGLFRFDANKLPSVDRITIPIDLESVIMEGSRRLKEWERLQEELPDLDINLRFTDRPDARLRNINLTVEEWRVVSFINPRNTVRQIAQANNLSDFQIRRIVYGLLQAGLVEFIQPQKPSTPPQTPRSAPPAERPPAPDAPTQTPVAQPVRKPPTPTSTSPAPPDPQSLTVKRSMVQRLIDRIRSL